MNKYQRGHPMYVDPLDLLSKTIEAAGQHMGSIYIPIEIARDVYNELQSVRDAEWWIVNGGPYVDPS